MAHSCRWRFPARPGGSSNPGTGRKAGRIRVTASLRNGTGTHLNANGLRPGFDAALQVSTAIGNNLQKFRDVLGETSGSSSGEEDAFEGFDTVIENGRVPSPEWTPTAKLLQEKKPRGRPPRCLQKMACVEPHPLSVITTSPTEKVKRPPGRPPGSGEKRRGRPPASGNQRTWLQGGHVSPNDNGDAGLEDHYSPAFCKDIVEDDKETNAAKKTPLGSVQQESEDKLTKVGHESKVRVKPLKPGLLKVVPVSFVPRRKRGRPPSAERLKAKIAAASLALESSSVSGTAKQKSFSVCLEEDMDAHSTQHLKLRASLSADEHTTPDSPGSESVVNLTTPSKLGSRLGLRQSPRHIKPVRTVAPSTIAKQLLQRAKKGAHKKKLEAVGTQGTAAIESGIRKRTRTQLKNIRQFIMPVVSTVSLRIIKTPKRFIEDEFSAPPQHMKIARLDSTVPAPVTHPSTTSSSLVSTAPCTTGTVAMSGAGPPVDTFPSPTPPVPPVSAVVAAGSLLSNNSCNSNGRFSSSAASCGSSAVSQHSYQLSSEESSRSSSPSLDDSSCDSQISDGTQVLSEEPDHSPSSQGERETGLHHSPRPLSPPSEPETEHIELIEPNRRGRRGQGLRRGSFVSRGRSNLISNRKRAIISSATGVMMSSSQAGSQQASSTASSSSSPPPPSLLTPPQPPQSTSSSVSAISEHHPHSPWIMPHPITPFLPTPPIIPGSLDKRRAILREPTFRWTSLSRIEQQYFSSAKYAKEGLIRKPIFDNFRPPPLTAEDVGLMPPGPGGGGVTPGGFPATSGTSGANTRLFSPLHHHHQHPSSRFEPPHHKRSPLLRAPRFTPSAAHSRIFESVTLPSSSGSSPSSQSPLQCATHRLPRRRRRKTFGHSRIQPRSPSHSMTTRSSQSCAQTGKSSAELSALTSSVPTSVTGNCSPLPGIAVSPVAPSALPQTPFNTFSSSSLGPISHRASDVRRVDVSLDGGGNSASSSSQLFPRFASSPQGSSGGTGKEGREKSLPTLRDAYSKEKDRETERIRDRGKENKKEAKKDREKRGKSLTTDGPTISTASLFAVDSKDVKENFTQKKNPGQKKSVSVDSVAETPSVDTNIIQPARVLLSKGRVSKKGRLPEKGMEADEIEKSKERSTTPVPPIHSRKLPSTPSLGSMLDIAEKQPATDRRVAGLIRKAKVQLINIEKSKSLKPVDQPKVQGQESDSSEASVRGPRIKHVCRRAAVALGRNRAVFPDDMPTLSALPWEEREKILSSMGNDDKSSVAGSEEAEPSSPPLKPVTRHKTVQEATPRKGRRSRRCGQCPGCQVPEDCGQCANCLDKPKFGGRNIKKQCCKERKCQNLQWMPSKMFLQKQAKGKKDKKKNKVPEKKEGHHAVKPQCTEEKQMVTKPDCSTLNFLSTPSIRGTAKQKAPSDGVHRIRVDFKEDFDIEKVWEMGGLSILTSLPITPQVVCFICASSGNVEFVFCQVCCEPFHIFCLGETERPLNEEWENWCCRRCRFCHVCGRQHQKTKAVMKPPELNPETEESLPSRRSPEGPDPPFLTEVSLPSDSPLDLASVEKKMNSGHYQSVMDFSDDIVRIVQTAINLEGGQLESRTANSMVKSFFIRQMERVFPWFSVRESKFWEAHKVSYNSGLLPNAVLPPSLDHNYAQWQEREEMACAEQHLSMKIIPAPCSKAPGEPDFPVAPPAPPPPSTHVKRTALNAPPFSVSDNRQCVLCLNYGDEKTNECGRLLYIGQDEWAHVNCALWSAEVFEDDDGSLKNVHMAVSRGRQLHCENCQKPGATVGCCLTSCSSNYHFMCARQCHCAFLEDKKVYCQLHRHLIKGEVLSDTGFEVTRRILVDFEGISLRRKFLYGLKPDDVHIMIGSMTIDCLGMLTELSDCEKKIFPIGYQCSRVYWSTLDARKRCVYTCRILACRPLVADNSNNNIDTQENNCTIAHTPTPESGTLSLANEIVSVGENLLSSSLPSIGSRRHSTSSLRLQPSRQKTFCGPQGSNISSQIQPISPSLASTFQDRVSGDSAIEKASINEKPQCRERTTVKTVVQFRPVYGVERFSSDAGKKPDEGERFKSAPSAVLTSPLLGTAVLTDHQRGSDSMKIDKGKQVTKDTDLPAGAKFVTNLKANSVPRKEAVITAVAESKDVRKTGSPQTLHQKTGGRKSLDCLSGLSPATALKPHWSPGMITEDIKKGNKTSASLVARHVTSSNKDKSSKVKLTEGKDVSKEKRGASKQ
ncbi:Histone-lysine N-methyltransferase 2A [Bagarius yarrelli]|uniref:[histone H3]-lysine(4) N-methyltransferase n=1 Tax=Bagarius yarrelli TaxID=175774 RepID=A0A556VU75_BAGYA|nr:Histone-lysine N-methyltransferase 2A [Bagarius yarrelli]